jgi:NTP pyrophosphatase (non-canonical NTP hydrolase)
MAELADKPTLADYQDYLKLVVKERGFDKETPHEVFTVFIEEIGELAKAMRKASGQKTDTNSRDHDLEEEAADVFFMLIDLCNRLDIDLAKAFFIKEEKNIKRTWA